MGQDLSGRAAGLQIVKRLGDSKSVVGCVHSNSKMPTQNNVEELNRESRVSWKSVACLHLDPQNPRIIISPDADEEQILLHLFETQTLEELALSFVGSGYFSEEPVVVVPHGQLENEFTVVEGNRRVATLKILLDPRLQRRIGAEDWPKITPAKHAELEEIPTVWYASRAEVVPYLGFRHITGVKTWNTFAKARYVSELIEAGRPLEQVEEAIGDTARTARKLYQAYVLYRQLVEDLGTDAKRIRNSFSILEVLLAQQSIKNFLGVTRELPKGPIKQVVPDEKLEPLKEIIVWVFGDSKHGQGRIISDSRQISQKLSPIVSNEQSLGHLRKNNDLEAAYEYSDGELQYLVKQLGRATRAAQNALSVIPLIKVDIEIESEIERLALVVGSLQKHSTK